MFNKMYNGDNYSKGKTLVPSLLEEEENSETIEEYLFISLFVFRDDLKNQTRFS